MATVIEVIAVLGMFCTLLSTSIALGRFMYNIAKDGLYFEVFSRMSPTTQVPAVAAALACIPQCVMAGMFDIRILAKVTTACLLITYGIINSSVLLYRFREGLDRGDASRPKFYIILFILASLASCLSIKFSWPTAVSAAFGALALIICGILTVQI